MQNEITVLKFQLWKRNVAHNPVLIPALLMSSMHAEHLLRTQYSFSVLKDKRNEGGTYGRSLFRVPARKLGLVVWTLTLSGTDLDSHLSSPSLTM